MSTQEFSSLFSSLPSEQIPAFRGIIRPERLISQLNEALVSEEYLASSYSRLMPCFHDLEISSGLKSALAEAHEHAQLIQDTIRDLGGTPTERKLSPRNRIAQNSLEELVTLETQILLNWQLLALIVHHLDDPHAQDALQKLVDQVEDHKITQLNWTKRAVTRLRLQRLLQYGIELQAS